MDNERFRVDCRCNSKASKNIEVGVVSMVHCSLKYAWEGSEEIHFGLEMTL